MILSGLAIAAGACATSNSDPSTSISVSTTTALTTTTEAPTFSVEGVLPDGHAFVVAGLSRSEELQDVSVGISVSLPPTMRLVGVTRVTRSLGGPDAPTWDGNRRLLPVGEWLVEIEFDDEVLMALGPEARTIVEDGIRAHSVNGMAVLDLGSPFVFTEQREIPLRLEVQYETFAVRRGCEPSLGGVCSRDGSVQVIAREVLPTTLTVESAYTGEAVRFLVLGVAKFHDPRLGRIDFAATEEDVERHWGEYELEGGVPEVDLDRHVVIFYNRAEDACPDYLLRLDLEGTLLVPRFSPPWQGTCTQPLFATSYAVSIDRFTLPPRFVAFLPEWAPSSGSGYDDVSLLIDLPSGEPLASVFGAIESAAALDGYKEFSLATGYLAGPIAIAIDGVDLLISPGTFINRGCDALSVGAVVSVFEPCFVKVEHTLDGDVVRLWVFQVVPSAQGLWGGWPGFVLDATATTVMLDQGLRLEVAPGVAFENCGGPLSLPSHPDPSDQVYVVVDPDTGVVEQMACVAGI